jgi:tetratricopeptide (TPR) repeat protein
MNLDRVGKYRVIERIGKGAMGEVYKAHDPLLNRYVALKMIAPALVSDPEFRKRFKREAQSAAQLNHPNIITVFDFGEEDGSTYMAMELLEGRDLKDVIRDGALSLPEKLEIMELMCDGLAFAHTKGVVHRDLKPGNVYVEPNGQVKILDFGLARLGASEMTRTGTVMGTPHYMSPEQVRGEKTDARSDVFSLGAVFYELLTQHRPFEADSIHGVLTHIVEQPPEPIRRWAPEVPTPIVAVVERALAKDTSQRYADAGELGRALAAARESLSGEAVVGSPPGRTLSTMLQAPEATLLSPAATSQASLRGSIKGATALTLARSRMQSALPGTVRPDPTVGPGPATHLPEEARSSSRLLLAGGVVVLVAAAAVGGFLWWQGRSTAPLGSTEVAKEEVGILTDALVTSQVELARADLANRDYAGAIKRANEALKLSPASSEARDVVAQAEQARKQLQAAVEGTRAAFARGDVTAASDALARVMALDPGHPVVAEMSRELNRHFRGQAEQSRAQTETARAAAEQARASSLSGFAEGRKLLQEGEALFGKQEFAVAAQRFSESRNAYERATREADAARAAAAVAAHPATASPAVAVHAATGPALVTPMPVAPSVSPTMTPQPLPSAALPSPTSSPLASPTAAATALASGPDGELRRVIADYGHALSSQDIVLYRSLKPDLSAEEEKTLKRVFKEIKSWEVGIKVESVQLEGERATVRASRQDVINGHPTKAVSQVFHLARTGGAWHIQAMSQ